MDRSTGRNRLGWAPQYSSGGSGRFSTSTSSKRSGEENINPYECIDEGSLRSRQGSGVGFGGVPNYHEEIQNPYGRPHPRSGSDGDGEDELSPPIGHNSRHGLPSQNSNHQLLLVNQQQQQMMNPSGTLNGHNMLNSQSLRRGRHRGGGPQYQQPNIILPPREQVALMLQQQQQQQQLQQQQENPYQLPFAGTRGAGGLSDSPTSENASDATLTDSELPFAANHHPPINGGILMGGNLELSSGSGRLSSLKRNLNSNGKSMTGLGLSGGHEVTSLDQYVVQTSGGKYYIPQDTPKNSTSEYKSSPSSSPSKKTSGSSLLYKSDPVHGTLRDNHHQRFKSDNDDYLRKFSNFGWKKWTIVILALLLLPSLLFNILFASGVLPYTKESAKNCAEEMIGLDSDVVRQSMINESSSSRQMANKIPTFGAYDFDTGQTPLHVGSKKHEKFRDRLLNTGNLESTTATTADRHRNANANKNRKKREIQGLSKSSKHWPFSQSEAALFDDFEKPMPLHSSISISDDLEFLKTTTTTTTTIADIEVEAVNEEIVDEIEKEKFKNWGWDFWSKEIDVEKKVDNFEDQEQADGFPEGLADFFSPSFSFGKSSKKYKNSESSGDQHQHQQQYKVVFGGEVDKKKNKIIELESNFVKSIDDQDKGQNSIKPPPASIDDHDDGIKNLEEKVGETRELVKNEGKIPTYEYQNQNGKTVVVEKINFEPIDEKSPFISGKAEVNPRQVDPQDDSKDGLKGDDEKLTVEQPGIELIVMEGDNGNNEMINENLVNGEKNQTGNEIVIDFEINELSTTDSTVDEKNPGQSEEEIGNSIDINLSAGLGQNEIKMFKNDLINVELNLDQNFEPSPSLSPPLPEEKPHLSGGACECFCPCMDTTDYDSGSGSGSGSNSNEILENSEEIQQDPLVLIENNIFGSGSGSGSGLDGNYSSSSSGDWGENEQGVITSDGIIENYDDILTFEENNNYTNSINSSSGEEIVDENFDLIFEDYESSGSSLNGSFLGSGDIDPYSKNQSFGTNYNYFRLVNGSMVFVNDRGGRNVPSSNVPPDGTSFTQITLGSRLSNIIPPYSYWNMQFYQPEAQYVTFSISVPRGASIGFYARRNALPSHTQHDIVQVLQGFKTRAKRSSPPTVSKELNNFLESGHWFLSLYNDDGDPQEVIFSSNISEEMTEGCPNGCSGQGQCHSRHCSCNPGFSGEDCSQSICPVLCSGRGDYMNGECTCNPGWKGRECSLRHNECEISDCNGHGKCTNGRCVCNRGFKGEFCTEEDCPHPTCSGHGFCLTGICMCKKGWKGPDCSSPDNEALQCLPDCSGHGSFNLETQTCTCEPRYTGEDCSQELCDMNCGANGLCVNGGCHCSEGWVGKLCNQKVCDKRCSGHGQCKNGTCLCVTGWNGRHCTLEGCPNSCSGHGQCKANMEGFWECKCHSGWTGLDCSVMIEQVCNDGKDNDKDGLTDCEDPECCLMANCEKSQYCVTARKPIEILLRKQPPAITASFFEKMKFLIEDGSLQSYVMQEAFNGSRSGVVRGRVVTPNGSGLMGVRISSSSPNDQMGGFTLSQDDGWFDLMVNGGGAVTITFGRSPFNPQTRTIFVPWNEVVIIDKVTMGAIESSQFKGQVACESHNYDLMKPVVLATWKHGFQGECSETSAILKESQVVQESIRIPGSGIYLMYHSSRAPGFFSTIQMQITPELIPQALKRIHLRITIEGVLFEKIFEADPNIKFTYAWNRLNIYRQRVYGITQAIVKIGYEYDNCASIIWDIQSTTLSGHDMSISDIGGWNLNIHHRYNFHEGIIQKGDGSNIYLKYRPRIIQTTMGNGLQRPLECTAAECNGVAAKMRLLAPVALASSPDGTLYVGDFNYIRRIMVDGTVTTILKLNATRISYRYFMTLSPVDNVLYISDPELHQIIRVKNVDDYTAPEINWEIVVGSGEHCLPGDEAHCGDHALAKDAKLTYPKGMAVSSDNILYFADGTNVRKVDRDGIITTIIGNHQQKSHWKPIPCEGTIKVEDVHLRWPTELAINPLDNSLYLIDDKMIIKLTDDNRVRVMAGRSHCPSPTGGFDPDLAIHSALISPQSISFGPNGDLHVAESDSQRVNRIRVISTDGRISAFAGSESKCNCLDRGCTCFEEDQYLASTAKFSILSSISMSPDGILHIADQGNYRIRSISALIPQSPPPQSDQTKQYEIYWPESQEMYIFNRFGQHVATKNLVTGDTKYTFLYDVNMSNGKLSSVTDSSGSKIQILRDYSKQVKTIENAQAQKFNLKMSRVRMLQEFATPDGFNVTFDYWGSTGLIKSKKDSSGRSSIFSYDEFGRLLMAVSPTGQVVQLKFSLSSKGAKVTVTKDQNTPEDVLIRGSTTIMKRIGKMEEVTTVHPGGDVILQTPWGKSVTTESVPYNLLGDMSPVLADSFPISGKQKAEIDRSLVNRVEWRYVIRKEGRGKNKQIVAVDKKMRVNGENILMIEYDRETKSEMVFIEDRTLILNVTHDRTGRPLKWVPSHGFAPVELEYDRFGRLTGWKWDDLTETYEYDRSGRVFKIHYADGTMFTYEFKDAVSTLTTKMTTAGGSDYLLEYDDAGAFQSLTTPRGHIHNFAISATIGVYEYLYKSPSSREIYKIQYNDAGQLVSIIYPGGSGRVNYVYNKNGQLDALVSGLRSTRYTYQDITGLLKICEISQASQSLRVEYKWHGGVLKEQKEKYGTKTSLDNVFMKYSWDGNGRIASTEIEIGGKLVQPVVLKRNVNTGALDSVGDLTLHRTFNGLLQFNRTVVQDHSKSYFKISEKDAVGRLKKTIVNIKGVEVHKLEIDYDTKGKIRHRKMNIAHGSYVDNIIYDADGHISDVLGSGNWKYVFDENGNAIQIVEQSEKSSLIYDSGDRVIQVGELLRYTYDSRGFLVQRGNEKFQYDDKGLLIHAVKKEYKVWFFYDHLERLISWKDDAGNITQFVYANPDTPNQITHMHNPTSGKNSLFLYDHDGTLIAIQQSDGARFYVACDQNGSPVAVFTTHGVVIKEIHRSPYGKIVRDTNPSFYLPIDYHGGLIDRHTQIVIMFNIKSGKNSRAYDPSIGQWITPSWDTLAKSLIKPTDIFTYRFASNDPITPGNKFAESRMTNLADWLQFYGFDESKVFGQDYVQPVKITGGELLGENGGNSALSPSFNVISGLDCIASRHSKGFKRFGFNHESHLNPEKMFISGENSRLMSKIAYRRSAFGPGLLVSRLGDGRTLVSMAENSVLQGVVTSVLNGSAFVDFRSTVGGAFYFVKDNPHKLRDDVEELKRLGGLFNVSVHDADNGIKELRLSSGETSISVRYGTEPVEEMRRLIKHAHRRAVERAWEDEKKYISMGLDGRRAWNDEEKEQLLSKGLVHSYRPVDLYSVHKYPQLADDPNNVAFERDSRRKRRKSQNKRHRASPHEILENNSPESI